TSALLRRAVHRLISSSISVLISVSKRDYHLSRNSLGHYRPVSRCREASRLRTTIRSDDSSVASTGIRQWLPQLAPGDLHLSPVRPCQHGAAARIHARRPIWPAPWASARRPCPPAAPLPHRQ